MHFGSTLASYSKQPGGNPRRLKSRKTTCHCRCTHSCEHVTSTSDCQSRVTGVVTPCMSTISDDILRPLGKNRSGIGERNFSDHRFSPVITRSDVSRLRQSRQLTRVWCQ